MMRTFAPAVALAVAMAASGVQTQTAPALEPRSRLALPASDEGLPGDGPIRRLDWFVRLWLERRTAWSRTVEQDRGAVVFLGDSITQGWGGGLGAAFPGMKVANRGIDGDTSRGVLIRLADDVIAVRPSAVVLLIGTNDLSLGATPETVAGNVRLILGALKQHDPRVPIILNQVFPSSAAKNRPSDGIKALNALLRAAVKNDSQVTLLETWPLFATPEGDAPPSEFPDLLHINEVGYAKWAAALRPLFATFGLIEKTPDAFPLEEGFESLFNGRDLSGWGYRASTDAEKQAAARAQTDPNAPARLIVDAARAFDGLTESPDGRYAVIGGRLVVKTPAEYRKLQQMWTKREFPQNFVLRLEFRATPNTDSGVYIRGPQLQCRDYLLAGPYKELKRYKPQDWNELEVTVTNGVARATNNGELVEGEMKLPATGPIGLEGDRGQMEYRRIRIKILAP
jgi:lysophospholipase L1-like esterase